MVQGGGRFVWYELLTSDPEAALAFYRDVIGWNAQPPPDPASRYTLLTVGETPVAGLLELPPSARELGARPAWIGYIGVTGLDAALTELDQAGGGVYRAAEAIPAVGRFAVVHDPQGTPFTLFQPEPEGRVATPATRSPGEIGWHELHATDPEAAFDFYAGLFGWTRDAAFDMGPIGSYQLFATGAGAVGGMMRRAEALPGPLWLYYFIVDSVAAAVVRVAAAGGQVVQAPMQVPGGAWIAQCFDPQGVWFAVTSMAP
nr:VOC family protein [uncultured Lichenicoccus sp.]